MRLLLLLLVALLMPLTSSWAILQGRPAKENQLEAAVQIWSIKDNHIKYLCSGTLIAPDVVITVAHCIFELDQSKRSDGFLVSNALKANLSKRSLADIWLEGSIVKSEVRHPIENVVLLFLKQPADFKYALLLQPNETTQLLNIDDVTFAGWGYVETPPNLNPFKQLTSYVFSTEHDERKLGTKHIGKAKLGKISKTDFKFGQNPKEARACHGDEGGPVVVSVNTPYDQRERLLGMIASDPSLLACGAPTTGIKFDPLYHFIDEALKSACAKDERVWCKVKGIPKPNYGDEEDLDFPPPDAPLVIDSPPVTPSNPKPVIPPSAPPPIKENPQPKRPNPKVLQIKMESVGCSCSQVPKKRR